eukprot:TRINITY_DN687_c1_g1_i1.p1 TRINITY_DN687_c1_g1~~TRINITY_DN687_c1_g1_i1.p1  ORF type:complete len:399 (+),score=126.85 TRINITY_DN687_c1_g1_i1:329-1525(+)
MNTIISSFSRNQLLPRNCLKENPLIPTKYHQNRFNREIFTYQSANSISKSNLTGRFNEIPSKNRAFSESKTIQAMKAIKVHSTGGSEVLKYEDVDIPKVGQGQLLVKNAVIGINFIDVYHRTGLYPLPLPFTPGRDGSGIVEEVGPGETFGFKKGDRVAYASTSSGSYADYSVVNAEFTVKVEEEISFEEACASMIQGLTAHNLVKGSYFVKKGDRVLVHAAAGGLGRLVVQAAKTLGATVIGTTSNEEKKKIALEAGCDHVILYDREDFVAETKRITEGKGVNVVYDSVGLTTFMKSLDCISKRGFLVSLGNSSGKPPPLEVGILAAKGSISVVRPTLSDYILNREEFLERANEVFGWVKNGQVKLSIMVPFPLKDAKEAHDFIEGRKSTGKMIMKP